ncbi:BRE1-domain-containing protein [Phlegmacium glaucopus]|nr:BRE1-domain-containing protein [Phlegmacium glaucopus]
MESRKRPLADEDDSVVTKKRILTGANGSPHVNGVAEHDDEAFGEKLEAILLFRKEAIYRRMKHYSREHERSQARIQELERRKSTCEAGLAAMSACWAQLLETIRLFVKPDDLPPDNIYAKELFDLTARIQAEPLQDLAVALGDTVNATQALVTKFVQIDGETQVHILKNEAFPQCQQAQNECVVLRSEVNMLRAKLQDSESQKEYYHNALVAAENHLERSHSRSVRDIESRAKVKFPEVSEEKEEVERKPSSPVASPSVPIQANGGRDTLDLEILQEQLKRREAKIIELEKEAALLKDQKTILELDSKALPLEQIMDNPHYKAALDRATHATTMVETKQEQIQKHTEEISQLYACRREWEDNVTNAATQAIQELKAMLAKRDLENARLREQREQQSAELNERKQKDAVKYASIQEYKSLLESNSERIQILQSELSRCKGKLAANAGAEDLMLFFLGGNTEDVRYVESLREQKLNAENRVAALERTFSVYQDQPERVEHMKAAADAFTQLSEANAQLEKYHRTYGDLSSLSPDVSRLAEQLRMKEEALERLRMSATQQTESEKSLFVELEKLSTAWETLDRQLKSKVFDLANLEDRLAKSSVEKAKSDNKYYAAMRDKEAIEAERKNLARTLEKQGKAVDHFTELEKQLETQKTILENDLFSFRRNNEVFKEKILRLEKENYELQAQLAHEKMRFNEMTALTAEREQALQTKRTEFRAKEDEVIRFKKELEREMEQLKKEIRVDSSQTKLHGRDKELKNMEALVICSTCHGSPRTTIITKCMHTFCKDCVDSRLSTRQRKCPACQVPFAHSDVHTFWFQ